LGRDRNSYPFTLFKHLAKSRTLSLGPMTRSACWISIWFQLFNILSDALWIFFCKGDVTIEDPYIDVWLGLSLSQCWSDVWGSKFEHASKVSFAEKSKEDKTISCKAGYRSESDKFISETIQSLDSCRCSWFSPPELVTMPVISSLTCRTHPMNDFCLPWSHWIGNTEATRKFSRFCLTKKHLCMEAILVRFLFCLPRFALIICSRQ